MVFHDRGVILPVALTSVFLFQTPSRAADVAPSKDLGPSISVNNAWDGFYIGGHAGDAFAASSYINDPASTPLGGNAGIYGQDREFGPLFGGLQAGYNYVTNRGFLLGAEADFSFPDRLESSLPLNFSSLGPSILNDRVQIFGSLRGRAGYTFGDWLVYGTGGFAYSRDLIESADTSGDTDTRNIWRPGWTAGAGVEVRLTPDWSAKLEYTFSDFARSNTFLPVAGEIYSSDLKLQTVSLGLNYRFSDPALPIIHSGIIPDMDSWSFHAQSTIVGMGNAAFPAAYSGTNSLYAGGQVRDTISVSGYIGYKAWEGTEYYYNPEGFQGFGLSETHGIAGFPNGEAQKGGFNYPHYNTSRLFLRHIFGLGGEQEDLQEGPNQVGEKADVSRVTWTFGKVSVPDFFDNNAYAHDPRSSFLNYSLVDAGAFDFAGDQPGFTWGSVVELNQKDWALRTGYFLLAAESNSNEFDTRLFRRGQYIVEFEDRYTLFGSAGKLRLSGWDSQCYCGSFAASLSNPILSDPTLDSNAPDIAGTRKTRSEFGFIANVEQTITDDLGLFARLAWRNGQTEIMQWTDVDRTASAGGVLKGTDWGRPDDTIGLAGVVNGLSGSYEAFLAAGGNGINIGDGQLRYRPEGIIETFYSIGLTKWASLAFDYQFIANPAYNADRGPVSVGAVRLHLQF